MCSPGDSWRTRNPSLQHRKLLENPYFIVGGEGKSMEILGFACIFVVFYV